MMKVTPVIPVEAWEWMWAPYDAPTYQLVLDQISADDIVLEIGAGDLRLSRKISEMARCVYAIEQNHSLLAQSSHRLPANVEAIAGNACAIPFPKEVTVAVLLMRHCTRFSLYLDKLRGTACQKLITNARWGMDVETIILKAPRHNFESFEIGWYACRCGNCGFKEGPPEGLTDALVNQVWELESCPLCTASSHFYSHEGAFMSTQDLSW